jgi:Fur family ferric uptake transcriptional regulator
MDELKHAGLRATAPRLKVLEIFRKAERRHLSADDIYRQLLAEHKDIGLATVYRALGQFEQAGLLIRHHFETGKAVYELRGKHHHDHFVCLSCGRVEEFLDAEIERRQRQMAQLRGWTLQDHAMSLYGLCPQCRRGRRGRK